MRNKSVYNQTGLRFQYEYDIKAAARTSAKITGRPTGNSGTVDDEDVLLVLVSIVVLLVTLVVGVLVVLVLVVVVLLVDEDEVTDVGVEVCDDVEVPVVKEPWNSSSLLLPLSETQRLPDESKAIPAGYRRPLWLVAVTPELKPG
jgi:hypothetical protein